MGTDKRFQVFVSSTYEDLKEERQHVIQALLEMDCIPAGMELFPAADDDQWTLIRRVIDACDYYIVIVGARYGSIHPDGRSFTQMEYEYAVGQGLPVLGFLHGEPDALPAKKHEKTSEAKAQLEDFRELVKRKTCLHYSSSADLGTAVMRSMLKITKSTPRIGWVRGDQLAAPEAAAELLRLRRRIEELEGVAAAACSGPPPGTEGLSQGDDKVLVHFKFSSSDGGLNLPTNWKGGNSVSWNELFGRIAPIMMKEASDHEIRSEIAKFLGEVMPERLAKDKNVGGKHLFGFAITDADFHLVMVQLRAVGLIVLSDKQRRPSNDRAAYWTLSPYGDASMTRLRALPRKVTASAVDSAAGSGSAKPDRNTSSASKAKPKE